LAPRPIRIALFRRLTAAAGLTIVPGMRGLNLICGICREIIR
jgi:hypothetical protein